MLHLAILQGRARELSDLSSAILAIAAVLALTAAIICSGRQPFVYGNRVFSPSGAPGLASSYRHIETAEIPRAIAPAHRRDPASVKRIGAPARIFRKRTSLNGAKGLLAVLVISTAAGHAQH